jgi:hypothetical protein
LTPLVGHAETIGIGRWVSGDRTRTHLSLPLIRTLAAVSWFNAERVAVVASIVFGLFGIGWGVWTHLAQARSASRARRESLEPMVVVDITPADLDSDALVLIIENLGPSVARNVRIAATPPPVRSFESAAAEPMHEWRVFTHGIPTMPPHRRMVYLFDIASSRFNVDLPMRYEFTVTADGPFGAVPPMVYDVDLGPMRDAWVGLPTTKDVIDAIKKAGNSLAEISKTLNRASEKTPTEPERAL